MAASKKTAAPRGKKSTVVWNVTRVPIPKELSEGARSELVMTLQGLHPLVGETVAGKATAADGVRVLNAALHEADTFPDVIQVDPASWLGPVKRLVKDRAEVVAAALPGIEDIPAAMLEFDRQDRDPLEVSYTERGVRPAVIRALFEDYAEFVGNHVHNLWPSDGHLAEVDCAALNLKRGVLCVVGLRGESLGWLAFRNLRDFKAMGALALGQPTGGVVPMPLVSMTAELGTPQPDWWLAEAARHRWPVVHERVVPMLNVIERGQFTMPTHAQVEGARAITQALTEFSAVHGAMLWEDHPEETVLEHGANNGTPSVTLRVPHPAALAAWEGLADERRRPGLFVWEAGPTVAPRAKAAAHAVAVAVEESLDIDDVNEVRALLARIQDHAAALGAEGAGLGRLYLNWLVDQDVLTQEECREFSSSWWGRTRKAAPARRKTR